MTPGGVRSRAAVAHKSWLHLITFRASFKQSSGWLYLSLHAKYATSGPWHLVPRYFAMAYNSAAVARGPVSRSAIAGAPDQARAVRVIAIWRSSHPRPYARHYQLRCPTMLRSTAHQRITYETDLPGIYRSDRQPRALHCLQRTALDQVTVPAALGTRARLPGGSRPMRAPGAASAAAASHSNSP